jgi:hypothetical protein
MRLREPASRVAAPGGGERSVALPRRGVHLAAASHGGRDGCAGDAALVAAGVESRVAAVVAIDPPLLLPKPFLERVAVPALVVAGPGDPGTPRGRSAIEALSRQGGIELLELPAGEARSASLPARIAAWLDRALMPTVA